MLHAICLNIIESFVRKNQVDLQSIRIRLEVYKADKTYYINQLLFFWRDHSYRDWLWQMRLAWLLLAPFRPNSDKGQDIDNSHPIVALFID
jgi:hypothetical protein